MIGNEDSGREARRKYLSLIDTISEIGFFAGGGLFVIATIYLLYGLFSGSMVGALSFAREHGNAGFAQNLQLLHTVIKISGLAFLFSIVIRYYQEEVTAYLLLVFGAVIYLGMPALIRSSIQNTSAEIAAPILGIDNIYGMIGIITLALSVPLIIMDIWKKATLNSARSKSSEELITSTKDGVSVPIYAHCWQMPYCREYLKKHCGAYKKRRDCWRSKSGCYCDEEMMLQAMKSSGAERQSIPAAGNIPYAAKKRATSEEKKERCRSCMLYILHQRQKFHLFTPLAFPVVILIMVLLFGPLMKVLGKIVEFTDRLALALSIAPGNADAALQKYTVVMRTSNTIEWVLFICIALVLVSLLLKVIEYLIFDLQM